MRVRGGCACARVELCVRIGDGRVGAAIIDEMIDAQEQTLDWFLISMEELSLLQLHIAPDDR